MNILAIAGSLRKESYNLQLAKAAGEVLQAQHPDVTYSILLWEDVPFMNQDIEFPAPEAVSRVREAVKAADGIWLFSPEYNHSIPGPLKNLIDWLSRPASKTEGNVLSGKPLALAGASIGSSGTSHAQDHLASILSFINLNMMNTPRLTIPSVTTQTENGILKLESSAPYLQKQADAFVRFIEREQR